jgi:ABC-2 type transport system permease protein
MMRSLITRTLYEKRWFIVGWGITFAITTGLVLMFYPSFSQGGGFDEVATTLPDELKGFIGDPNTFKTLDGFIASQLYDIRMPLILMIMTLVLASSLTLREEENGDTRTLLSTHLSRTRLVLDKFVSAGIIVVIVNLFAVAGTYVGAVALGENLPHLLIWQLFTLSTLFGIASFSIPFGIASATNKRGLTMFVGLLVAIGSYILTTFARAVDWLKDWDRLSLMHYYHTDAIRQGSFDRSDLWVLLSITMVMVLFAIIMFRRRDVA